MNIYEKMLEATKRINTVAKNLQVEVGKGRGYKAVQEADVLAAVKPVEAQLGIYSYPVSRKVIDTGEIVSTTYNGQEKRSLFMRIETVYRFVNVEKPEEYVDLTTYGDGVDSQDKAPGKAMTYGDKYALLKAYKIQTGDDPDAHASEDLVGRSDDLISDKERMVIESMCMNRGWDPYKIFTDKNKAPIWPKITKAMYTEFVKKVGTDGDKRTA